MANENVVTADLKGGWSCVTAPLWQWDYGQVLEITGIDDLPSSFAAHCANRWDGSSQTVLGSNGRLSIPNDLLTSGEPVYVWIILTADGTDGETKYKITIPVNRRAAPTDYPTTAQQSAITQAINALNTAAANAAEEVAAELVDPTLAVSGKAADAAKTGEELSNLKSDSVHGTNQNLTSTTGTDICNDDLNNLPLNVVYGIVPYSGLTHMPYTETGSEYGGIIFSVSKQYPANATATQILIRRDGHVFTRQYWNSWESWFEYVTYSEITALVDNYVALAFFGSEQNITSTTVQSICSGDANNLPNNRIMGINIAYNGITNLPTDYPDGIKSKYGGCVITFGKQSSRGYGDTQIFVGYGSQTYIRVYTGSWQNWRCLSTQKFNNIVGVGDSICEGWRNYNKGFVGWLNVPYTNLGVTGATLGFAAGHTQIFTEIENITYTKDVIISDGGINDYYFDVPLGDQPTRPVTNDTEASSIDKSTVSGGLSYLCYLMITKMPKAQRYFLITHKTNNYPYTANGAGYTQQQLHDRIVEVCKLYNVHIIDVYEQSIINSAFSQYVSPTAYASDTSVTTQYYVDSDGIHPLALGYQEGYYPIIRQALQSATTKI